MFLNRATAKVVTTAADNGSGLFRLTVNSHGLSNGDTITIAGGLSGMNGDWVVANKTDHTIDLTGSTYASGYVSGGVLYIKNKYTITLSGTIATGIDVVANVKTLSALSADVASITPIGFKLTTTTETEILSSDVSVDKVIDTITLCSLEASNTVVATVDLENHSGTKYRKATVSLTAGYQATISADGSVTRRYAASVEA